MSPSTPHSPASVATAAQALLRRFRSQKPIRGGSLILTLFGDAIAPRGGVVTLGSLIRLSGLFGLTERLVRTSVGRLAQDGWLEARRDGRRSEYSLTPSGQQRFAEATRRIYGPSPASWSGEWTVIVLPADGSRRPDNLRDELRWLGCGQVCPGVFAHPSCSLEQAREWLRNLDADRDALLLKSTAGELAVDRRLVAAGWDLGELGRRYRRFVDAFRPVESALEALERGSSRAVDPPEISPEAAFITRTLLIHEYRKIHLREPLLPPELLPDDWVGARAYELCGRLYGLVFAAAEGFLSDTASTLSEALPPAGPAAYARFGGLPAPRQKNFQITPADARLG